MHKQFTCLGFRLKVGNELIKPKQEKNSFPTLASGRKPVSSPRIPPWRRKTDDIRLCPRELHRSIFHVPSIKWKGHLLPYWARILIIRFLGLPRGLPSLRGDTPGRLCENQPRFFSCALRIYRDTGIAHITQGNKIHPALWQLNQGICVVLSRSLIPFCNSRTWISYSGQLFELCKFG